MSELTVTDHDRDRAGLTYVYPVLSRRSGGLSIGINLNPNNACNWRCIYCQVPGLIRGGAPAIDLQLLEQELTTFLASVSDGSFYDAYQVPTEQRIIRDIAISGNGEPTSLPVFDQVVEIIGKVCSTVLPELRFAHVLITNGSLINRTIVQRGLAGWKKQGGEIWFKLDSATRAGTKSINNASFSERSILKNLATAASYCPVWIQTCIFSTTLDNINLTSDIPDSPLSKRGVRGDSQASSQTVVPTNPPNPLVQRGSDEEVSEQRAYIKLLRTALDQGIELQGVLLYGPARLVMQPEASAITPLTPDAMHAFANKVREKTGLAVKVIP